MGNRSKYRKLPELFVVGKEVTFSLEGEDVPLVMWLQVLNPFEMQEARNAAQAARGRSVMAIKMIGSPEYDAIKGSFVQRGREQVIEDMANNKYAEWYLAAQAEVEADPDWVERMVVLRDADTTAAMTPEESELLVTLNTDYMAAISGRVADDRSYYVTGLEKLTDEELLEDYLTGWTETRGQAAAMVEFNATEVFYGARVCEAVPDSEGRFTKASHDGCDRHRERVFDTLDEVRQLPEGMQTILRAGFEDLAMTVREAKNSDRQGSSSASSPLPSTPEESTPSIPTETSEEPPGT